MGSQIGAQSIMTGLLTAAAKSDAGSVRDQNEDAFLLIEPVQSAILPVGAIGCIAVADGMGGHFGGGLASRTALAAVKEELTASESWPSLSSLLRHAVAVANERVYELADPKAHRRPGTTLTILLIGRADFVVMHVGDSRAYLYREGILERLTVDHTRVAEELAAGRITDDDAATSPIRHLLSRSIGNEPIVEPQSVVRDWKQNDLFLLCSDGLTEYVSDPELQQLVGQIEDREVLCETLIRIAKERGGADNVTVAVVECLGCPVPGNTSKEARMQETSEFEVPFARREDK